MLQSRGARKAAATFSLMERLKIRNKLGRLIAFVMNATQTILAQYVAWCWHRGTPVRAINPKYRQGGVSTFWALLFVAICLLSVALKIDYRVAVVAQDDHHVRKIFEIYRTAIDNLPLEYDGLHNPAYEIKSRTQAGYVWKAGCSIQCHSIKTADALGRGGRLNAIHYSEAGNFADKGLDATGATNAIDNSLSDDPDSIVAVESTANGHDEFFWALCEASLRKENDYTVLFLPWYLDQTYAMDWSVYRRRILGNPANDDPGEEFVPTEEEELLRASLDVEVPERQRHYRYRTRLTNRQLIWRRWTTRNKCKGRSSLYRREYPSTYEEAFSSTEDCLFPGDVLAYYRTRTCEPVLRGTVELSPQKIPTFLEHPHGELVVWERPIPGEDYLLTADTSEGLGRDFSAGYVFHKPTLRIVAALHGQYEWEDFAELVEEAAYFYNQARVAVENNGYGRSVNRALRRAGYPRLFYFADPEARGARQADKPGFPTTVATRTPALLALAEAARSHRLVAPDKGLVTELGCFVKNEAKGKYEARAGANDDRVMAAAIACYLLAPEGIRPQGPIVEEKKDLVLAALEREDQLQERENRRGRRRSRRSGDGGPRYML